MNAQKAKELTQKSKINLTKIIELIKNEAIKGNYYLCLFSNGILEPNKIDLQLKELGYYVKNDGTIFNISWN